MSERNETFYADAIDLPGILDDLVKSGSGDIHFVVAEGHPAVFSVTFDPNSEAARDQENRDNRGLPRITAALVYFGQLRKSVIREHPKSPLADALLARARSGL